MPFTLEQRYQVLTLLNEALLRTHQQRAQWDDYGGEFRRFDAKLSPTEYQENRPKPTLFTEGEIWTRLDDIEQKSEFLVKQVLGVVSKLEQVEQALDQERMSPNSALKKADVLEWEVGSRSQGMTSLRDELIEKLRYHLGLPPSPSCDWGGGMLLRS
jgi:hypothetical protein